MDRFHELGELAQVGAFAAQRFGDQKRFRLRVKQTSWVKLIELHIGYPTARTPRHRDAIAAGAVRVAGIQVNLAGASGGQHYSTCLEYVYLVVFFAQRVDACTA